MQARSQVSLSFLSITPSRQISLQVHITQEMEDSQRLLCIPAGTGYHKEKASKWYATEFWVWGWQW